jgi:Coenzyme PQQ synthesis protein D (PqqD)
MDNMPAIRLSNESRIVASPDQVSCDLAGEAVVLNLKNSFYYGLDPVGATVWSLIQEPKTFAEIREALLDIYEVDSSQLESDLQALLGQLSEQGLIDIQA